MNTNYQLDTLLFIAGYNYDLTIRDLTDHPKHKYSSDYTLEAIKAIIDYEVEFGIQDYVMKQLELNSIDTRIRKLKSDFIEKEFAPLGVLDFPEVSHLLYYGFDIRLKSPQITIEGILKYMDEKNMLFHIVTLEKYITELPIYDTNYFGKKYSEISVEELKFEMLEYVINGAMFAKWYIELLNRRRELEALGIDDIVTPKNYIKNDTVLKEPGKYFYHIMKEYFLQGCKILNDSHIANVATLNTDLKKNKINEEHARVLENSYKNSDHKTSVKRFAALYKRLLNDFVGVNKNAYNEVERRYNELMKKYEHIDISK